MAELPSTTRSLPDPKTADSKTLALALAGALVDKQAEDVTILDVSGPLVIADYFVVVSAKNPRHALALGKDLDYAMKHAGRLRRNFSGITAESDTHWVLLDFDDVVVHIFMPDARNFYALESLWADVPRVPFDAEAHAAAAANLPGAEAAPPALEPEWSHVIRPKAANPTPPDQPSLDSD